MEKLTQEQKQDLAQKIDSEGFDYYFTSYGPDEILIKLIGKEIEIYSNSRNALVNSLAHIGVEVEP